MKKKGAEQIGKLSAVEQLQERPKGFLIVGIGASAGGIQALKEFFEHVPADSHMAYVVILHLSPDHDSKLAEVLQTVATIPVKQVLEHTKIEPNHVYVVPPAQHLVIEESFIAPTDNMRTEDRRAPVDIFFRNLADVHGPRAVCVVLSGTGANGSMGLKRIKERGGAAYVQNPREAEFNEMPRNSIATELVDEVLNVAKIPGHIIAYRNSVGSVQIAEEAEKRPEDQQQALREIFTQLRIRTGHDFSNYKRPTLLRRIERRINIRNLPDLPSYTAYLHERPDETQGLLKDLLISVTNFFRDIKAFETVEQKVIPSLFEGKTSADSIRIWVAGCATGEEAYSVAMLCAERVVGMLDAPRVQIFATDIDEAAIATARDGFYTLNDAADVSPERLRRFFTRDGEGYRVRREIREMILFANHNFLKDPPFSKLDLVTCRNVLIYLNNTAQERVIETFHFALKPKSFLFLGSSESVDGASDLYAVYNRDYHIFQSRETTGRSYPVPESVPSFHFPKNTSLQKPQESAGQNGRMSFGDLHQKLLEQYAPPSAVVNEEYEIVHISERAGKYFEFSGGEPSQNLLKLIRPEIRLELRSALYQAVQNKTAVEAKNLKLSVNGQLQVLDIHIRPVLEEGDTAKGFLLVIFKPAEDALQAAAVMRASDEPVARQLEEELIGLKVQLRAAIEQHEYGAEELKASNEELQAMNEELRSAAEELETSKEELQSINEELRTVNQELKVKIDETGNTSNNLQNLINSANVGTIFLDRSFAIRLFTPAIQDLFNLKSSDHGRPITDITNKLQFDGLLQDAETVLEKLTIVEREVTTTNHQTFMMRILPYRTSEDRINGVVITFFDITKRKASEIALKQSEDRLRLLIESAKDYAIFMLDAARKVVSWSSGARMILGYNEAEIIGKSGDVFFLPDDRALNIPEKEIQTAAKQGRAENERWHLREDGSRFWGSGVTHPLYDEERKLIGFVKIMRDLTHARHLEEAKFFLASIVEGSHDSVITIDFDRNITSWNKAAESLYGYTAQETIGKNLNMLTLPEDFVAILKKVDAVEHSREVVVFDTVRHRKGGGSIDLEIVMSPVLNAASEVIGISTIARDVTARKRREEGLAFLAKINLDFAPLLSVHDVMEPVGQLLSDYLNLSRCHFSLVDVEADRLEVVYEFRRDQGLPSIKTLQHVSDKFAEDGILNLRAGKPVVMNSLADKSLVKGGSATLKSLGFRSLVYVPHLEGNQWKFLLTVGRMDASEWRNDELEILQELAAKIYIRVERAKAEEALRKSEAKFRRLSESGIVALAFFEIDGPVVDANQAFLSMLGVSREELQSNKVRWDIYTPKEWLPRTMEAIDEFKELGFITPYEKQFLHSSGELRWGLFTGATLEDRQSGVALVIDITQRKRAEEALHKSEQRFRTLADVVPQVIWTNTADGKADYFNQRWYEYSGLTYEQSFGLGWQVMVHPDDAAESIKKWNLSLAAGEVFDTEYRLRRDDGRYCWFIGRNVPLKDEAGNVTGWFGSATDVENLKKTEEALSQSEARLRITMESATDYAIITMNTERKVERWSEGATQLFQYTEAEMRGKPADVLFTEEDRATGVPQKEMATARDRGRAADDRWHQRKDGSRFFVNGVMRPIQDGKLTGYVKVLRDMTQQQLFTENLHRLVAERTLELQRSNNDLRQFASIASHDLQEPLRKLKLFASILQKFKSDLPAQGQDLLSKISVTSERMSLLIREVLQFSKIAYGVREFSPTNLNQILQNVLSDLDMLLDEAGATINYASDLPEIEAAPVQINQLFYNLLTNSVKFKNANVTPVIQISVKPLSEEDLKQYTELIAEKEYIEIVFADNGIGFEQQYAEQVFQIFERLHSNDDYDGTGVGLALCQKIVENHSGSIYAVSSEGKGAEFHIVLPVKQ